MKTVVLAIILGLLSWPACGDEEEEPFPGGSCDAACNNILACREAGYSDSDLQSETFSSWDACQSWCSYGQRNYPDEAPEKLSCASHTTSCEGLDDVCDVF